MYLVRGYWHTGGSSGSGGQGEDAKSLGEEHVDNWVCVG